MTALSRRRFLQLAAGVGAVSAVPAWRSAAAARPIAPGARWMAGDFHVHTVLSHDVWSGPNDDNTGIEEFYTWGWTAGEQILNAELRGLDFVAITDHDRVEALRLPEYKSSKLVLVPGYEHSLSGGHAGIFMRSVSDLPTILRKDNKGADGLARLISQVHERHGMMVLNHPKGGALWTYPTPGSHAVDAVEVWNSQWLQRHDVFPISESNNHVSIDWWEREFLGRGVRRAAVGGSDNHWRSTFEAQGVGQPTTWVLAAARTPAAIIEAVQAGRTAVSWQPPALLGPQVTMTATELYGDYRKTTIGGEVRPLGPVGVTVRVRNGLGHRLRLISTGQVIDTFLVGAPDLKHTTYVVLPERGWLRAELYQDPGYVMTAVTSAIFAAVEKAPPRTRGEATVGPPVGYGHDLTVPEVSVCCGH
ncbi:MAG TPA: CehA/McbA family metallohydrolase [Acidimicrobiales bacterium]|nr:CehA/McbA family metallohydrolase [Acidimicrobiales bacterium]